MSKGLSCLLVNKGLSWPLVNKGLSGFKASGE